MTTPAWLALTLLVAAVAFVAGVFCGVGAEEDCK